MAFTLDEAILTVYPDFDTPADQIVADPAVSQKLADKVNSFLPGEAKATLAEINKRVLNLRRRGEDKGGLPRLRRTHRGRNNHGN
jgi:hypothetical protein